jgi:hypothetical protein
LWGTKQKQCLASEINRLARDARMACKPDFVPGLAPLR